MAAESATWSSGTPAEVVLRMRILKHLFDWSYDELEREVRADLVYRAFTRSDANEVPDAKTILKIARVLGPETVAQLHQRVVDVAQRAGVTRGRRFRIDTTVVETMSMIRPTARCSRMGCGCRRARCSGRVPPWAMRPGGSAAASAV